MAADLILVRHGKSVWNDEGRCQGTVIAPPLNESGREQARIAAVDLAGDPLVRPAAIYASNQSRAMQTAQIVGAALGLPVVLIEPRLREMDQGQWQGILYSDIKEQWGDLYRRIYKAPFETTPPGGETMAEIAQRVFAALDDIARFHPNEQIVIVSHEIPLALIRCAAYGSSLHDLWNFAPHNCQPSRVLWPLNHPISIPNPDSGLPDQEHQSRFSIATGSISSAATNP